MYGVPMNAFTLDGIVQKNTKLDGLSMQTLLQILTESTFYASVLNTSIHTNHSYSCSKSLSTTNFPQQYLKNFIKFRLNIWIHLQRRSLCILRSGQQHFPLMFLETTWPKTLCEKWLNYVFFWQHFNGQVQVQDDYNKQ